MAVDQENMERLQGVITSLEQEKAALLETGAMKQEGVDG